MHKKLFHSILIIAALVAAMSFSPGGRAKLIIRFENYVGDEKLKIDSVLYENKMGQTYSISMFKYYVGNFHFKNIQGKDFVSKGYFLINQEDESSMQIILDDIPSGEYNGIGFTLGVDSIDNCNGAQSGALDPVNGMFWAWNSGYIFLKMEGISAASNSTGKRLEFHIGGYKEPNNCIKIISLKLKHPIKISENNLVMIRADASHLFSGSNPVDFSKLSSVTDFHNAKTIADNYSSMFSIIDTGK
jgi:hypothetical protein